MSAKLSGIREVLLISGLLMAGSLSAEEPVRIRQRLADNWRFAVADPAGAEQPQFDDSAWRLVSLPHDWSIEGKFEKTHPAGAKGGFLPTGIGWYRFTLEAPAAWSGRNAVLEFEGVYMNSRVYCNGRPVGGQPYGYTGFFADLTGVLTPGKNVIAVRVDNLLQSTSRWYNGSGIYRHVWLHVTDPLHVLPWGVFAATTRLDANGAVLSVRTQVKNATERTEQVTVDQILLGCDGRELARLKGRHDLPAGAAPEVSQELLVKNPPLWSPEKPQLVRLVTRVFAGGRLHDEVVSTLGVRSLAWSVEKGLQINGQTHKLCGGNIHHDNGCLGAAAFDRAEERKVELLKAAGFNALRTSHNPPSPALLDACDRLGVLVMDEAFDGWVNHKTMQGYNSLVFKEWWPRDLAAMVRRDRNHPAVVFWSIGNEVPEQYTPQGAEMRKLMAETVHRLDPTRPVTQAFCNYPKPDEIELWDQSCAALDIVGYNYNINAGQEKDHIRVPQRVMVSTEQGRAAMFGLWQIVNDNSYIIGDFVWTAQDYLGTPDCGLWELTESNATTAPSISGKPMYWPWHGAPCGDLDINGWRKASSYYRNIVWDRGEKLHLTVRQPVPAGKKFFMIDGWASYPTEPSWTWAGFEGQPVEVEVYSRYDKVRLLLNGKVVGPDQPTTRKERFHAVFKIPYLPGTLKAVGLQGEKEMEEQSLVTAGAAATLRLTSDRNTIRADGQDLAYVTVEVLDQAGRLQPQANGQVSFQISGSGSIAGLSDGSLKDVECYQGSTCRFLNGRALVVLRAGRVGGTLTLKAQSNGLVCAETRVVLKAAE